MFAPVTSFFLLTVRLSLQMICRAYCRPTIVVTDLIFSNPLGFMVFATCLDFGSLSSSRRGFLLSLATHRLSFLV